MPNKRDKRSKRRRRSPSTSSSSSSNSMSRGDLRSRQKIKRLQNKLSKLEQLVSTNYHIFPSNHFAATEAVIQAFDPLANTHDAVEWVNKIDDLAIYHKWDEASVMKLVAGKLRGNARRWYDSLSNPCITWAEMKQLLVENFPSQIHFGKLLVDAANYRPGSNENLSKYCFEKLSKLRKLNLNIPDKHLVDSIIEGIGDSNICLSARAANFSTVGELASFLSHVTYSNNKSRPFTSQQYQNSYLKYPRNFKNEIKTDHRQVQVKSNQQSQNSRKYSCYNCKGSHSVHNCPNPIIKCENCKFLGHKKDECPKLRKRKNVNHINEIQVSINPPTNTKNIYVMKASINNLLVNGLIDTGSTCTILKLSIANNLKLRIVQEAIKQLKCFMGNIVNCNRMSRVCIKVDQVSAYVNILLLEDSYLSHDLIIGTDFLNQTHVLLTKIKDKVRLKTFPPLIKNICCVDVLSDNIQLNHLSFGDINERQKAQVCDLINKYKECVSFTLADLGKTNAVEMHIKTTVNDPIVYSPYRMAQSERPILNEIIQGLLENNIIRESNSPFASPVLLVKKKTNDYRMCVDYRKLNAITIKDKYPLPRIEDQIDNLGRNVFFVGLDLASGFYQVPMSPDSIEKTAFVTPDSHYEFLRMPFGLANSPAVFQKLMNNVLGNLKNTIAFPYIDDIIIPSTTFETGLKRLELVLQKLQKNKLTLKLSKCSFFKRKIVYLGQEISADGVKPGEHKIEAVARMTPPSNVKQTRQFLGLCGYFRKYMKDYATIVEPLTRLMKKNTQWTWGEEQQKAFSKVKEILTTRPILTIFDPTLYTELHTDASAIGFGGILIQKYGKEARVVAYFSKQTTPEQRYYHSYELETLAVVLSLRHFRVYLLGLEFKVVTDCSALRTTFSKKDLIPRIGRWWLEVLDYNFSIEYRPGSKMGHVDALSRNPVVHNVNQIDITEGDWILAVQLQDDQICRIRNILKQKSANRNEKQYHQNYTLRNERVFRKIGENKAAWVVPQNVRWQICRLYHDNMGHFGLEKTLNKIKENYWFPGMRHFVKKYVSACLNCMYYKAKYGKAEGYLNPIEKVPVPMDTLHIDHLGPFVTSKKKNKYIFVVVDGFTKFCIIEPVRSTKSKDCIKVLMNVIHLFGTPRRIISDRGTAFTSESFKAFCLNYNIKHVLNAVATPRANGQCERYNRTILASLSTTAADNDEDKWDIYVKQVQSAINCTMNSSTGTSPLEALAGYKARHIAESKILREIEDSLSRIDIKELRKKIKDNVDAKQVEQKRRYDLTRKAAKEYDEDDLVMVSKTDSPNSGQSKKMLPKFKGPFRITKVLLNDRYVVQDLRDGYKRQVTVVAADKIKPWVTLKDSQSPRTDYLQDGRI